MADGWPLDKKCDTTDLKNNPWLTPSDVDISVSEGEEFSYLSRLSIGLKKLLLTSQKSQKKEELPDLVVVVNGSDPSELDTLPSAGLLRLSQAQMLKRDQLIHKFLSELEVPQVWLMAGGYGDEIYKIYLQFLQQVIKERIPS
jgi:acetoin utilization deacetylase AcuC-like enzyme